MGTTTYEWMEVGFFFLRSPAYYRGTFSDDGNTLTGGWTWPGGGYASTATRVD